MKKFFESLVRFLEKLSSKPKVGALQINDSSLQYLILEKGGPVSFSLRLPPGVIKEGKIESPKEFAAALFSLRRMILPGNGGRRLKVIVSLPSSLIYTQSFSVPKIDEEKLEESARLNLQIISPMEAARAIASSEVIGETEDRYDLLGAFVEREIVLTYRRILAEAGFDGFIFEFPSLGLARAIRLLLTLSKSPFLALQVSSDGIDLSILRGGSLYFEYFRSWRSIQGEAREITRAAFESAITEEVRRVIDFSNTRFKESPAQALLIAPGFEKEIGDLVEAAFGIKVYPLVFRNYALAPVWYSVLGSALRGQTGSGQDREINLSGENLAEALYAEQLQNFVRLWRNIAVGVAAVMLVVFGGAAAFLTRQANTLTSRLNSFRASVSQNELTELTREAGEFNYLVTNITKIKANRRSWYDFFSRIKQLADANAVTIDAISAGGDSEPFTLSARAPSTAAVIKFKNILVAEKGFSEIDLPLAAITTLADNSVSFSVRFKVGAN